MGASAYDNNESKRDKREVQLRANAVDNVFNEEMNPNNDWKLNDVKDRTQRRGHEAIIPKGGYKSNIKMEWMLEK